MERVHAQARGPVRRFRTEWIAVAAQRKVRAATSGLTRRQFLTGALATTAATGLGTVAFARPSSARIRILFTNDTHGHLVPIYHREAAGEEFLTANRIPQKGVEAYLTSSVDFPDLARQYGKVGGFAHLAGLVNRERNADPERTLLLDAGDAWYGSAMALLTEGRALVRVMNAMRYDAMTLHWEFNLGREALLARVKEATFAVLAQNLVDTEFEDRVLKASLVRDLRGIRIAVIGQAYPLSLLTTERRDANPGWRMGYREEELAKEIRRVRREEGAQIVVLLSHMGTAQDRVIARRLQGVDVIVGGHTHDILWKPERVGSTLIVQAGSHGKFLGALDLELQGGRITPSVYRLIPVLADRIEPDPTVAKLIGDLYRPHRERLDAVVGETRSVLYRSDLFGGTTDAFMVAAYRDLVGADIGCAPGWRFGTTLLAGPIRAEDVYNAMKPTPSPLYTVKLTGRQIREIIEDNLDNVFNPDPLSLLGGDVQRCSGVAVLFRRGRPRGQRIARILAGAAPLQDSRPYTVATSGGRSQYRDPGARATARPAVEELIEYIRKHTPIRAERRQAYTEVK